MVYRFLRPAERELINAMLLSNPAGVDLAANLEVLQVTDMHDGGMGSIRFLSADRSMRKFGKQIAATEYIDEDGVLVSITINTDNQGDLFEVDFWKTDFSVLRRYPNPLDLKSDV